MSKKKTHITPEKVEPDAITFSALQAMIDDGSAWLLEDFVGRAAIEALKAGNCVLGEVSQKDIFGNKVPSRHDVVPGTVGSQEYADKIMGAHD